MNNLTIERQLADANLQKLQADLQQLQERVPELPLASIMLSRMIVRLGRGMAAMLDNALKPFGLTESEFRVLTTLFAQPEAGVSPTDICAKTAQSPANMSRLTDALVSRGLITRISSLNDRRKMVLRITEQGESVVRDLLPTLIVPLREVFQDWSDEEQLALVDTLGRLGTTLGLALSRRPSERAE
jgi:MarR family transcriptional regulator, negative regulator of the multidrug operon emrRAB